MPRLARVTFNTLTAISLLLWLVSVLLWARSYFASPWAHHELIADDGTSYTQRSIGAEVGRGEFLLSRVANEYSHAWLTARRIGVPKPRDAFNLGEQRPAKAPFRIGNTTNSRETSFGGFSFARVDDRSPQLTADGRPQSSLRVRQLALPMWSPALIFAVLPAVYILRRRRRAAATAGRCAQCSYDLTGNVSGICPECGATIVHGKAGA